jgi:hypothetical protein
MSKYSLGKIQRSPALLAIAFAAMADFFASRARSVGAPSPNSTAIGPAPYIAGQQYNYLVTQLRDFRNGSRTDDGGVMAGIATALTDSEIDDVAGYLARQHIK